ncbi:methyltransferase domain-containing protein [Saccharothrix australiensis]|uniref:methyltransferase domain-containing protein n=1 Tax=Saccharothrix australiensis TaxID=2072 RepID=UPI001FE69A60|nr:methyltransferase domain-containing protein [Saccharothrix australiensis]
MCGKDFGGRAIHRPGIGARLPGRVRGAPGAPFGSRIRRIAHRLPPSRDRWNEREGDAGGSTGGNPPNPYLAREVGELTPGTALDAGCGAGAEATWLAERGRRVTAADTSAEALARAAERATASRVGERLRWWRPTWAPGGRTRGSTW